MGISYYRVSAVGDDIKDLSAKFKIKGKNLFFHFFTQSYAGHQRVDNSKRTDQICNKLCQESIEKRYP